MSEGLPPASRQTSPEPSSELFPPFDRDEAFDDLASLIRSDRPPIVLIGAGASVKSGYPSWPQLLKLLKEVASQKNKAQWKKNIDDLSDAPWIAEIFKEEFDAGGFCAFIQKQFGSRGLLAEPHLALAKMPFRHFLTTNFDPCIEEALKAAGRKSTVVRWNDTSAVSDFLMRFNLAPKPNDANVVYLHGRYDDQEENIILTERSYVARYIASDDARGKLMAIFMTHPVLFVGFSMNDPDLANLMREVTARLGTGKPAHYALMNYKGDADRQATRSRMENKFGVRPVFYCRIPAEEGGDDYSNLSLLLDALNGQAVSGKVNVERTERSFVPAEFDPDDPHKGRFGGLSEHGGRRLSVQKIGGSKDEGVLHMVLTLESVDPSNPITGKVHFHLHPTFQPMIETVSAKGARADLEIEAFGAFTLGVEIDVTKERFEVDLASLRSLPIWFRQQ